MPPAECPVSFWRFAGPVLAGQLGGAGAAALGRYATAGAHPTTRATAATILGIAGFWLAGGLTWIAVSRR
jgi:hypothetical protein